MSGAGTGCGPGADGVAIGMSSTEDAGGEGAILSERRDQILKLVTKGFYNELVNYGVGRDEIVRVASHLLDNVLVQQDRSQKGQSPPVPSFTLESVVDRWKDERRLGIDRVTLRPLEPAAAPRIARWLEVPAVAESFAPPFPAGEAELSRYLFAAGPTREYLGIEVADRLVGIVGCENLDLASGKAEMRKLVGDPELRGQGIGKRATFGFLYYAFMVLGLHKVYVHSRDFNVRNINLNSGFGFELEGVFLEDVPTADGRRADLIRMALLRPLWLAAFATPTGDR